MWLTARIYTNERLSERSTVQCPADLPNAPISRRIISLIVLSGFLFFSRWSKLSYLFFTQQLYLILIYRSINYYYSFAPRDSFRIPT